MSMDPPASRTPSGRIRRDGEVPDSQDEEEQHSSDFQDLLEEAHPVGLPAEKQKGFPGFESSQEEGQSPSTLSLPPTSRAAHSHPIAAPPVPPEPELQKPTSQPMSTSSDPAPPSQTPPVHPQTTRLQIHIASLQAQISETQTQLATTNAKLQHPERADAIVKAHIALLHEYNEIKDVGLGLMGLIADGRGIRLGGVMEEFGVGDRD